MAKKTTSAEELKERTKIFSLRVIKLFQALPKSEEAKIMGKQLLRSATSVAANYRAVCRARSNAEFLAKLGVVVEEADESVFWLELITESGVLTKNKTALLLNEANELLLIMSASKNTVKGKTKANSTSHKS